MRILIVDDHPENLYLLRSLLAGYGYEVVEASHGAAALELARQQPPDLVITDLLMPVMDGFTLLREWKADPKLRAIPLLVYTATYTEPEDEQLARDLGADAFLVKPAEPEPFLEELRGLLEQARQRPMRAAEPAPLPDPAQLEERYARALLRKLEKKCAELRETNRALQSAQDQLWQTLEVLPAAAYICDAEGLITYYNTRARELWGREPRLRDPADRFCGSFSLHRPDGTALDPTESWTAHCLRTQQPVAGGEVIVERPDGSRRHALACAAPLTDASGRLTGAVNVLWDITDLHAVQEALRQSEERFRRLAECSATAIFVYAGERFVYVNPAACTLTGRSEEELLQTRFWEVVHPDHRELVRHRGLARQRGEPVPARYEFKLLHKDGTERWIDFAAAAILWENRPAAIGSAIDITDRKRAEEALRESDTRNRIIANLISDYAYIFRVTPEGELIGEWVTESFTRVFGLTLEQVIARGGWQTLVHPDDLPKALEHARKVAAGQRDVCEMRWITPAGQIRWLRDYAEPVFDQTGTRVIRVYGASQDITEQRLAEERLARLNRTYAVLSQINQLIVREGRPTALLEGACRIAVHTGGFVMACAALTKEPDGPLQVVASAGADPDTLLIVNRFLGDPALGCTLTRDALATARPAVCNDIALAPEAQSWQEAALARGYRAMASFPLLVEGRVRGVLNLYAPAPGFFDAEETQLLSELAQDIGFALEAAAREEARRQAEARLAASEERFRQLADTLEDLFWIKDAHSQQFLYVSPAFERIWGIPARRLEENPKAWLDFVHPEDRDRIQLLNAESVEPGPRDVEYRIVRPDRRVRWVRSRIYPVLGPDGRVNRWVGVTRDITRERELEQQLLQAQKMEAVGRLAGGVAHDFNNILTAIIMQTELLSDEEALTPALREGLQQIHAAAERAANLTRQLLLFSRRQVMQMRILDLNESVTGIARMLQRIIGEDVRLQLDLHPGPLFLRADPGMLDQVLMNLAVNARDAMPQGGSLTIQTAESLVDEAQARLRPGAAPGRYAVLRVRDEGCGMPREVLEHIFEPFFTTKEPGKGTGLGLATVYGIVQQHRGWIEVRSAPGQGTTFEIYLPLETQSATGPGAEPRSRPPRGTETVLLVEDDASLRRLTRAALERHGYTVHEAGDAAEALEVWARHRREIRALLTDIVMPGPMNGRELARHLQADRPNLRVILFSGYSEEMAGRLLELGPHQTFLPKPFPPELLLRRIREMLDAK